MTTNLDNKYIERCFELAEKGKGKVSPNPLVGAVIVKDGQIVSEGWHSAFGKDHAEAMAIKKATVDLTGATLYCNLEPCIHTNKKTPPCYPLVTGAGIKRVVISNLDPNPEVAGKSVEQMRQQGIEVLTGVLKEKGHELNRFFFKHIKEKKPWVTVKIAQSVDAKITKNSGQQTWLTGKESKGFVHGLRAVYDAVLVGSTTVNVDNPQLNVRQAAGRNPLKVILSAKLNVDPKAAVFQKSDTEKVCIVCDQNLVSAAKEMFNVRVKILGCALNPDGSFEPDQLLEKLYEENIGSLLIEGGQMVFSYFLSNNLCDELIVLQAPVILGEGLAAVYLNEKKEFALHSVQKLGHDICFNLRKKPN